MRFEPKLYQQHAIEHVISNSANGLLMEMGLGKTVATLTAIDELMYDRLEVNKVLIIAPKHVADEVWTAERDKWDHLKHLKISKLLGTEKQRKEALKAKADIYTINCENTSWLIAQLGGAFPFDMLVIDESSKFKNSSSGRFKALKTIRPKIKRVVILTGTPVPNGLLDIWSQAYLLDRGERLGTTITSFRERYFTKHFNGYDYNLREPEDAFLGNDFYEKEIYDKIGDICISMKTEDWLELPERIDRIVNISLPKAVFDKYEEFEREQVLALEDLEEISAVNAAALRTKLLQFANGAIYNAEQEWFEVHNEKIDRLEEILDTANGKPVFVFYSYQHDKHRIKKHLKAYNPIELKTADDIRSWNRGTVKLMLAHPASAGHGLNLQAGGHIVVWFGLPNWNLELYQQGNTRFHRQGQTQSVIIHHLLAAGTMDEVMMDVLQHKGDRQEKLMQATKAIINKHLPKKLIA